MTAACSAAAPSAAAPGSAAAPSAAAPGTPAAGSPNASTAGGGSGQLVFVSYGGTLQDAQVKSWAQPFADANGLKLLQDQAATVAKIKAQVQSGSVQWDVAEVTELDLANLVKENLLEPIDYSVWDQTTLGQVPEQFRKQYGVAAVAYSFGIAYRTDLKRSAHPTTWQQFWDANAFPGPRALPAGTFANPPWESALLADGVAPNQLYPIDFNRVFTSLDKIKPSVKNWFTDTAAGVQALVSGDVDYASLPNGRVLQAKSQGAPVDFEYSQSMFNIDYFVIPKGAPDKANAMKFLAYMSSAEPSKKFMEAIPYGMPNTQANTELTQEKPDYAKTLPTAPDNYKNAVVVNGAFYGEEQSPGVTWQQYGITRWNQWYGK
jgi:putative spermidine/putrescine transport system substrate-binding protein